MKKELDIEGSVRAYVTESISNVLTKKASAEQLNVLWTMSEVFASHKSKIDAEILRLLKENPKSFKDLNITETKTKRSVVALSDTLKNKIKKLGYDINDLTKLSMLSITNLESVLKEEDKKHFILDAKKGKDKITQT